MSQPAPHEDGIDYVALWEEVTAEVVKKTVDDGTLANQIAAASIAC